MLDKSKLTGADISIDFCGCHLQSPYILSSGPLCYGAEGMIKGHEAGAGAVVTKTIRLGAAHQPGTPHGHREPRFPDQLREVG